MNKKKLSLLFLTAMFTMLFSVGVMAATPNKVTGVKQTAATSTSIKVEWNSQLSCYYLLKISEDKTNWYSYDYGTSSAYDTVSGLAAGKTYYARVVPYTASYASVSEEKRIYGEASDIIEVVTAPSKVSKSYQTAATTSSVTINWDSVVGATSYQIYEKVNGNQILKGETSGTSFTVSGLKNTESLPFSTIEVYSVRSSASGFKAVQTSGIGLYGYSLKLVPAKVKNLNIRNYFGSLKEVSLGYDTVNYASGYEYQLYEKNGKKAISTGSASSYVKNVKENKFYKVRVRAYTAVNGKNVYGEWSDYTYFAQQPKPTLKRSKSALKVSWKKVAGATNYTVYMSTSKNSGYKKVATTKKTSVKVSKFKKKKLNKKKTYYVYVVANAKVGKKTYKSNKEYFYYLY